MLSIAGQTAGPVGLDFFLDTYRLKNIFFLIFFHGQRWVLQLVYIVKQDNCIYIYIAYSRLKGWTDCADIFCGHSWVAEEFYRLKNRYFFQNFEKKF